MPKFPIVMCICGIFATVTVLLGHSLDDLMYLKTKTLNRGIISVVFFSCFKKCLYQDSHSPWWMNFADYSVNSQSIFMKVYTHYFPFMS